VRLAVGYLPRESTIVAKVMATARAAGWWAGKLHGNAFGIAGMPDVMAIRNGRVAFMEVKVPGEEPTRVQYHRMRQLAEAGAAVTWVTSAGEAKGFLEGIES